MRQHAPEEAHLIMKKKKERNNAYQKFIKIKEKNMNNSNENEKKVILDVREAEILFSSANSGSG